MAERLFHDYPGPLIVFFFGQAGLAQLLDDWREETWGYCEIEKFVSPGVMFFADFVDLLSEALIRFGILKIALNVVNALLEPIPLFHVDVGGSVFRDIFR